jgi:hypothetical protein
MKKKKKKYARIKVLYYNHTSHIGHRGYKILFKNLVKSGEKNIE